MTIHHLRRVAYPSYRAWITSPPVRGAWEITEERVGDAIRVTLNGELDLSAWERLEEIATHVGSGTPVVVDGSGIAFCDSTALRFLVRLRNSSDSLTIERPSVALRSLLDMIGLLDAFTIVE
jgi:anti-anti-sigma factor